MATHTIVKGMPGRTVSPRGEKAVAETLLDELSRTGTGGLRITWVYDDVARTLTGTFSGSIA